MMSVARHAIMSVTDTWREEEELAIKAMFPYSLKFRDTEHEMKFLKHLVHVHIDHHYNVGFKVFCAIVSVLFIAMYDILGYGGAVEDSEGMQEYYSTRLKWDAGIAVVWFAMFMASVRLPMTEHTDKSWEMVCFIGGPLVFALKEGSNLDTFSARHRQLLNSQLTSGPWAKESLNLAESNFLLAYFFNSCGGSLFVLLLVHAVLKFDWFSILSTTSCFVGTTITLAVLLELELEDEFSTPRTISTALFSAVAGFVFVVYGYNEERRRRMEWHKTHVHVAELARLRRKSDSTKIVNVKSGMDGVINTLIDIQKENDSPALRDVISTLRSGQNLWEANHSDMNAMPTWLQEQNRAYMMKKENDAFIKKHAQGESEARAVRGGAVFEEGERVEVIKVGSHTGKQGVITEPDWNGRIQVKMDEGTLKSYLANEIQKMESSKAPRRATITTYYTKQQTLFHNVDEWEFDVLGLQKKLHSERLMNEGSNAGKSMDSLVVLGMHLFERHRVEGLGLKMDNLLSYLSAIEQLYNPNPYHNAMHGADCMRGIHYFYVSTELVTMLTHEEKFAGLFAGAVHDVQV
jgi:hypothetical protein